MSQQFWGDVALPSMPRRSAVAGRIHQWVEQDWIREDSDHYVLSFDYKRGKFYINGRMINHSQLDDND